jgi:hypothetical protein
MHVIIGGEYLATIYKYEKAIDKPKFNKQIECRFIKKVIYKKANP